MFIELTDHLRCPAEHEERYLVLLPDRVERRSVVSGQLGCPVCGRTFLVRDGVAELGAPPPDSTRAQATTHDPLTASAAHVFLGLGGPGGYVALVGSAAAMWRELSELVRGVAIVAVNPPAEVADAAPVLSVVRAPIIPIKSRSLRGVVLGSEHAGDAKWQREAARVTLPGLRIVGRGAAPALSAGAGAPALELLASAGDTWVAARR
ncbi:MAG TPA: hypothetical protein VFW66_00935 [Gemmatimonadales bacterium]|nr:hypothetical protein [Gemmatimonadales bacterium]